MESSLAADAGGGTAPAAPNDVADGVDHQLDPRYVVLQRRLGWISSAVYSVLSLAVAGFLVRVASVPPPALLAPWALLAIAHGWWGQRRPEIAYRHASYRVDPQGIEIRSGVFWRRVINVPRSRVQHTDVSQGPFERRFGLATLTIFTAGASHAMVTLAGLDHGRALRIRDFLLPRETDDVV